MASQIRGALRKSTFALIALTGMSLKAENSPADTSLPLPPFGVVNAMTCMNDSKLAIRGKQEVESLHNKFVQSLEELDKQVADSKKKLNDQHYRDGLTAQADEQLKESHEKLVQERDALRSSYPQQVSQLQMMLFQDLMDQVTSASIKVAQRKNLTMVWTNESIAYHHPEYDITPEIIVLLDQKFDEAKGQGSASSTDTPSK